MSTSRPTAVVLHRILKDYYLPPIRQAMKQQLLWDLYFREIIDTEERDERIWACEWLTRVLAYHGPMTYGHLGKLVRQHKPGWTVTKLAKLARELGWHDPSRRLYLLPAHHLATEVRP